MKTSKITSQILQFCQELISGTVLVVAGITLVNVSPALAATLSNIYPPVTQQTTVANSFDLLVPAYGNPCCGGSADMWDNLISLPQNSSIKLNVILNPNNGPGVFPIDPNYINPNGADPLLDLKNSGAIIYGYVATNYGNRNINEVKADINQYYDSKYYRDTDFQIDGIFLDEMSADWGSVGYYQEIQEYIEAKNSTAKIIGNLGISQIDETTIQEYAKIADTLVTFENTGEVYRTEYTTPSWADNYSADKFAHLIHSESDVENMLADIELAKSRNVGMIYVTNETFVDDPWDNLASYWDIQVETLTDTPARREFPDSVLSENIPEPSTILGLLVFGVLASTVFKDKS